MVQDSSKMERDFLGLNQINYSSQQGSESASKVIRPHPLTPSQFLSSEAPTREDGTYYPFPSGSSTPTLSLGKNRWTSPSTNITPSSSTSVINPIELNNFNLVTTFPGKGCIEDSSITRNKYLQPEQLESLSMLYSGNVHVFRNISPEKGLRLNSKPRVSNLESMFKYILVSNLRSND
ncbi:hypothetical protein Leryth_026980 [Lithospermum erythrorhizon]|nr:hypothetical protein Leryth_026980 [Lithospermum erythrorhizon]